MTENEKFHERLARLRQERKLTAKAMSLMIEVPETTYREWEYGRGMKLPPCLKICQVLDVSLTELITGNAPDLQVYLDELRDLELKGRELRLKMSSLL